MPLLIFIPIVILHKKFIKYVSKLFKFMKILRRMDVLNMIIYEDIDIDEKLGYYN